MFAAYIVECTAINGGAINVSKNSLPLPLGIWAQPPSNA